ncbi:hypothetical protein ES703_33432 [subsurface metagenome]
MTTAVIESSGYKAPTVASPLAITALRKSPAIAAVKPLMVNTAVLMKVTLTPDL